MNYEVTDVFEAGEAGALIQGPKTDVLDEGSEPFGPALCLEDE